MRGSKTIKKREVKATVKNTKLTGVSSKVKHHVLRLLPGQDLMKELDSYLLSNKIKAAWIVTCVGSLTKARLRYANKPTPAVKQGHFEIVSLVGVLTPKPHISHVHMCISDGKGRTFGGHVLEEGNIVYTTAEIVLGEAPDLEFVRLQDGATKWEELRVRSK